MKQITISIVFILLGIVVNTVPRWVFNIDGNTFCQYQALSFVLIAIAALSTNRENKLERILWEYTIGLTLNNLYDEVFGDPLHIGYIEITVAILFTLCTLYRIKRCLKKTI